MNPLVSLNILSYNRKDDLRNTLNKVYEQDYKNIEVIVVDNASEDGSSEMVEKEFPEVILIKMKKNIGITGWNGGFKTAKGDYILVLDDDAYPEKDAINLAVEKLENNNDTACIAFNIFDLNSKTFFWSSTWLPSNVKEGDIIWPVFVGCAAMFSQKKLKLIKPMPENYFLYQHELPISAEIYNKGFNILFNSKILAYHKCKPVDEYSEQNDKLVFKNNLLFIKENIPGFLNLFYKYQSYIFYLTRSLRRRWFKDYKRIIKETKNVKLISKGIKYKYLFELRKLHLFNFSVFSKLKYFLKVN